MVTKGENAIRGCLNTIIWRIFGILDTVVVLWIITEIYNQAFSIGVIENYTKKALY